MSSLYRHCKIPNFCVSLHPSFIISSSSSSSSSSMEVSFLQHIISSTTTITSTPQSHLSSLPRLSTKSSAPRCSLSPKFPPRSVLPRDRIISFGRHKGKRLGSLPSSYLKWVSKKLKKTQFEDWALLADQVLTDPVYGDRIEWEYVQRILQGDFGPNKIREHTSADAATEIHEIAEKFDWDMEDEVGWSAVNFGLLGTSDGGRLPRKKEGKEKFSKAAASDAEEEEEEAAAMGGDRRKERRERRMLKSERELGVGVGVGVGRREREVVERDGEFTDEEDGDDQVVLGKSQYPTLQKGGRFPGRESLFKKVIKNRKKSS